MFLFNPCEYSEYVDLTSSDEDDITEFMSAQYGTDAKSDMEPSPTHVAQPESATLPWCV